MSVLVISGCGNINSQPEEEIDHLTMNDDMMENGLMSHDEVVGLNDLTGLNKLKIPSILERDNEEGVVYTVRARKGKTEILDGTETNRSRYNGSF